MTMIEPLEIPEKILKAQDRFDELEKLLADPAVIQNKARYQQLAKEYSELTGAMETLRSFRETSRQLKDLEYLLAEKHDPEFEALAQAEATALADKRKQIWNDLKARASGKKQIQSRDLIIEVRAGTGGQEASLFAADLYRMYAKYADQKGWKVELMSSHPSDTGGFKEVIFSVSGPQAAQRLQWESGGHRVQRVPVTEASGRIHTSAATVAVLFEPEEVEIAIDPKDLKIDAFRSSGPGGQSVNTTDSAIRITYLPTGMVVTCQDERSQLKNKIKAMRVLRARLLDQRKQERFEREAKDRKQKIGSGDRSEKIRTYNFPARRVTDHRIGFTTHKLMNVLNGELDELTDALVKAEEEGVLTANP